MPSLVAIAAGKIIDELWSEAFHGAIGRLMERRARQAREVLEAELRKGRHWAITEDAAAAAIFSYLRAAREGTARVNLQMIAEALRNSAEEPTFASDEFRRHVNILAELSNEEIVVLAAFIRHRRREGEGIDQDGSRKSGEWNDVCSSLLERRHLFRDGHEVVAHTVGLLRTGLVIPWSGLGAYTGFSATPRLDALARLVDFELASLELEN